MKTEKLPEILPSWRQMVGSCAGREWRLNLEIDSKEKKKLRKGPLLLPLVFILAIKKLSINIDINFDYIK